MLKELYKVGNYKNQGKLTEDYMLGNQWVPLSRSVKLTDKIKLGAELDKKCSGGQISHINISSPFVNFDSVWDLTNEIALSGLIYFAFNMKINVCEDDHAFIGTHCKCGKTAADTYSRVVGFLTPKSSYSKERKREFDARQWFTLND